MPVARSQGHAGRALLASAAALVLLAGGLWLASSVLSRRNSTDLRLGDQTFDGGSSEDLAEGIAADGPRLYSDVSGRRDRDVVVQHLGDDASTGWYAFLAAPPDKARDCTWQWQADEELFRARCDRTLTAPADGEGLKQFPVTVADGRVTIDLNAGARSTTTTTGSTTTSSTVIESGEPEG